MVAKARKAAQMARLVRIAALLRDARLAEFGRIATQRHEVERALESLAVPPVLTPPAPTKDTAEAVPLVAALAHTRWVLAERGRHLSHLARLRAAEAPMRDAAAKATGRAEVLARLAGRVPPRR